MGITQSKAILVLGLGIVAGLLLGLSLGLKVWPVRYVNVTPSDQSDAFQGDYVYMISASYARTGDLALARKRLRSVGYGPHEVRTLAARVAEQGGTAHKVQRLTQLANALEPNKKGIEQSPASGFQPTSYSAGAYRPLSSPYFLQMAF
ncbi:MAG: hypothetical protein GXP41_00590 [Chloroflexi bacterium]|nr:hypothetical protein [Chloroflexota bacterium]